jgi:hypothetical protein
MSTKQNPQFELQFKMGICFACIFLVQKSPIQFLQFDTRTMCTKINPQFKLGIPLEQLSGQLSRGNILQTANTAKC